MDLGEAAPIDRAIDAWRKALRSPMRTDVKLLARVVDEKVMQPIRRLLGGTRRLLISPDGSLNLIPFTALVDESGHFLIENYSLSYLTSGRDLLRLQVARESKSSPLVIADPAYGERAKDVAQAGQTNEAIREVHFSKIYFGPLLTAAEARTIKRLMPETTVLMKKEATESALKQVHAPSFLHIATHGFFLKDNAPPPESTRSFWLSGGSHTDPAANAWAAQIENPLLRSGLALAGANQRRSGDDDGVLTALEAAGLDLWGTKLVVLSACDTGLGEVKKGEGVYGLRRALVLAGSESQVMSLWKVKDDATRDLMIAYYTALKQGEGRGEALRKVQLDMLSGKLKGKMYQHPYYWASFIQSGEWANLAGQR